MSNYKPLKHYDPNMRYKLSRFIGISGQQLVAIGIIALLVMFAGCSSTNDGGATERATTGTQATERFQQAFDMAYHHALAGQNFTSTFRLALATEFQHRFRSGLIGNRQAFQQTFQQAFTTAYQQTYNDNFHKKFTKVQFDNEFRHAFIVAFQQSVTTTSNTNRNETTTINADTDTNTTIIS